MAEFRPMTDILMQLTRLMVESTVSSRKPIDNMEDMMTVVIKRAKVVALMWVIGKETDLMSDLHPFIALIREHEGKMERLTEKEKADIIRQMGLGEDDD